MNSIINKIFRGMKGGFYIESRFYSDLYTLENDCKWEGLLITPDELEIEKCKSKNGVCVLNSIDNIYSPRYKHLPEILRDINESTLIHHMSLRGIDPFVPLFEFYEQERKMNEISKYSWKKRIITLEIESKFASNKLISYLSDWSMIPVKIENGMQSFVHKIFEVLL